MLSNMNTSVRKIEKRIVPILKKRGVLHSAFFGSTARGEAKKNSDIDLLIEPASGMTLYDLVDLKELLERAVKKDIDLVTYRSLSPHLRKSVLRDMIPIL